MITPKVSIVVPIYNGFKHLDNCVSYLRAQTYENLEFILVDDGSTDGSSEKCDSFAREDDRFKVIHQKNSGVSSARNAGTEVAAGEYIIYYDVDDNIVPNLVEDNVKLAVQNDADVVMFGFRYRNVDKGTFKENVLGRGFIGNSKEFFDDYILLAIKHETLNAQWNKVYKKSFLEENNIRFMPEYSIYEDMIFSSIMLPYAEKIVVNDKVYYTYNLYGSGTLITRYVDNYFAAVTLFYTNMMAYCDMFPNNTEQKSSFSALYVSLVTANLKKISCNDLLERKVKLKLISDICRSNEFRQALLIGNLEPRKIFVKNFALHNDAWAIYNMYRFLNMIQR